MLPPLRLTTYSSGKQHIEGPCFDRKHLAFHISAKKAGIRADKGETLATYWCLIAKLSNPKIPGLESVESKQNHVPTTKSAYATNHTE